MLLKNKQKNKIKSPSLSLLLSQACLVFGFLKHFFSSRGGGGGDG